MKAPIRTLIAASLSSLVAISYSAGGKANERANANEIEQPDYQGNDFYRAIGKLNGALTCTGSFIAIHDSPDAPAYVLSNGHCAIDPFNERSANTITVDEPVNYTIAFNYFHDSKDKAISVRIESIVYATMKGTDIALLKTDQTIAQLRQQGLEPFRLSDAETTVGEAITVSGIPIRVDALQNSFCTRGRQVDVVENYWHWYAMVSNACEGISTGSSGSPVFNAHQSIIGVLNTTSTGAIGETCYNGNPCEVTDQGPRVTPGQNYAVPTRGLSACFDPKGIFNLAATGCTLPKPSGIEVQDYPTLFAGNETTNTVWKFSIRSAVDNVRVKKTRRLTTSDSCQDIMGYGLPMQVSQFRPQEELLNIRDEAVYQYCVIAGHDERAEHPEVVQVIVDNTPPTLKPRINILLVGEVYRIEPIFNVPEYADYYVGLVTNPSLTCANVPYAPYRRIAFNAPSSLTKICVYGYDLARNKSPIFEYLPLQP